MNTLTPDTVDKTREEETTVTQPQPDTEEHHLNMWSVETEEMARHKDIVHGQELCAVGCAVIGAFAGSLIGPQGILIGAGLGGMVGTLFGYLAVYTMDKFTHHAT